MKFSKSAIGLMVGLLSLSSIASGRECQKTSIEEVVKASIDQGTPQKLAVEIGKAICISSDKFLNVRLQDTAGWVVETLQDAAEGISEGWAVYPEMHADQAVMILTPPDGIEIPVNIKAVK